MPLQSRLNRLITPFAPTDDTTTDPAGGFTNDPSRISGAMMNNPAVAASTDATGSDKLLALAGPMMQQYSQLMQQFPNPANYQPSKTRRVLAALAGGLSAGGGAMHGDPQAGMRGYALSQDIVNAPWNKAMGAFDVRAKALEKGADVEQKMMGSEQRLESAQSRIAQMAENARIRDENYKRESDAREARIALDTQKADQAHADKVADMQRKIDEANQKAEQARINAENKQNNAEALQKLAEARIAAQTAQRELQNEIANKKLADAEAARKALEEKHKAETDYLNAKIADLTKPKTTETTKEEVPPERSIFNPARYILGPRPEGKKTETTTTTIKGGGTPTPTSGTVRMTGPDGKIYEISSDKVEQAKKDGLKPVQ